MLSNEEKKLMNLIVSKLWVWKYMLRDKGRFIEFAETVAEQIVLALRNKK